MFDPVTVDEAVEVPLAKAGGDGAADTIVRLAQSAGEARDFQLGIKIELLRLHTLPQPPAHGPFLGGCRGRLCDFDRRFRDQRRSRPPDHAKTCNQEDGGGT